MTSRVRLFRCQARTGCYAGPGRRDLAPSTPEGIPGKTGRGTSEEVRQVSALIVWLGLAGAIVPALGQPQSQLEVPGGQPSPS